MRNPALLRKRFSSPGVSRTATPSHSRAPSLDDSLEALEGGAIALSLDQGYDDDDDTLMNMNNSGGYDSGGGGGYYSDDNDLESGGICNVPTTALPFYETPPPRIQRPCRNFVPDKQYKDYLYRQTPKPQSSCCCNGETCAWGCAFFSLVAVLFLLFVGILIDKQPLYIQGIKLKAYDENGMEVEGLYSGQRLPAASNAYASAGAYFITMMISMAFLHSPANIISFVQSRIRRRHYRDIPDAAVVTDNNNVVPMVFHDALYTTRRRRKGLWTWVKQRVWKPTAPKTKRR